MGDPYPGKIKYQGEKKQMSWDQLAAAVIKAGWPADKQATAVAVAAAESGRYPNIYNTYKEGHWGLFQISKSAWPEFFSGNSGQWADPVANARMGHLIYQKQGWSAWEAHTRGLHLPYKLQAEAAVRKYQFLPGGSRGVGWDTILDPFELLPDGATDYAGDLAEKTFDKTINPMDGVLGGAVKVGSWLSNPANWVRIGYVGFGGVIVVAGLVILARPVVGSGTKFLPAGKVANMAKKVAA